MSTHIKIIRSLWKRLKPWHDLIFISAAVFIVTLAFLFYFLEKNALNSRLSGIPSGSYNMNTVPNPFPGLPEVKVATSSGAVVAPKSDWGAQESPTMQIKVDKLSSGTAK